MEAVKYLFNLTEASLLKEFVSEEGINQFYFKNYLFGDTQSK